MCACAIEARTCNRKKNDKVESAPLDVYGIGNLATVTKINLHTHYVRVFIMSDPWLSCWHEETRVLAATKHYTVLCSADDQHWSYGPLIMALE